MKTNTGLENSLLYYVYGSASHWKKLIMLHKQFYNFVAAIVVYDWKQFGNLILILKSKLRVTNSWRFPTIKTYVLG